MAKKITRARERQEAIWYGEYKLLADEEPFLKAAAARLRDTDQERADEFAATVAEYYQAETGCTDEYAQGIAYQAGLAAGYALPWRRAWSHGEEDGPGW